MGFGEFIGFIAACMAINALAIDIMLPALPLLTASFHLTDPNQAQTVIGVYLIGTGISQLFYGPISDRYGRRVALTVGLLIFVLAGILSTLAESFSTLLAARALQGIGAGAPRVTAVALARDRYVGAQMAKVMSMAMVVFMVVPVLAPTLGQLVLFVAPWRWVFGMLVAAGIAVLWWMLLRLPETLAPGERRSISPASIYRAYRQTLTHRRTFGYMLALSLIIGAHLSFISSAQQILVDIFGAGASFTVLFALIAAATGLAAFFNARMVHRLGMRRICISGLIALLIINVLHLTLELSGRENLLIFMLLQGASVFIFGFLAADLNALAMEPMGHIAGTASSMIGFFSTVSSALIALFIGHLFNGTVIPLLGAYVALTILALGITWRVGDQGSGIRDQI
jgi:DHA1 family bicyclomycin/chloramphenicol resistance-like MFS transporter